MTSHNRRNSSKLFHRHDKTVLSASRPLRRCELDNSRQLKTVADRKYEVWTRSEQSSNSHRHMIPDKTKPSRLPVDRHRDASQARSDVVRHAKCKHAVDCCTRLNLNFLRDEGDLSANCSDFAGRSRDSIHTAWYDTGVKRELLDAVKARKLAYHGHSTKKQGSGLEK